MPCRKRGHSSSWIRPEKRYRIYKRDRFACVYCGEPSKTGKTTIDHVKARSNGGNNNHTNLVTACHACNSSRQDKPLRAWCGKRGLDYETVRRRIRNAVRRKLP